jgi:hypothetical protein
MAQYNHKEVRDALVEGFFENPTTASIPRLNVEVVVDGIMPTVEALLKGWPAKP